jgi:hypothetical protein
MFSAVLSALPGMVYGQPRPLPEPMVLMWQVTGDGFATDLPALQRLGINAVQSFGLSRKPAAFVDGYLRAAEAAGLVVIPYVGINLQSAREQCELTQEGADFVRRYASNPVIAAWHSADEPSNHGVSKACQARLYQKLKELDPTRPIMVSTNFTKQSEYDAYFAENGFDILDLHRYVNPSIARAQRNLVTLFRKNQTRSYPVIVTLRAFNAPQRVRRVDMRKGDLIAQYRFFFEDERLGGNIGFYGWELAPNKGISQIPALRSEFEQLMREKVLPEK